jgi:DNA mismatch endonuclease, patch repair protein
MADIFTIEKRGLIMSAVRSTGSKLEKQVATFLRKEKIRYRSHPQRMLGKPDFYLPELEMVVFVDSCFWHGCRYHGSVPKTNRTFWNRKITRNKERDREIRRAYGKTNYRIVRIWEHQLKSGDTNKVRALFRKDG